MAFGQPAGPPATAKQIKELLELLQRAGHVDFRDARGPMGFNQRQAGGRFTRDEAGALIEQLQGEEERADEVAGDAAQPAAAPRPVAPRPVAPRASPPPAAAPGGVDRMLRDIPSERLAAELTRRGWMAIEPLAGP